ncbi:hypothetical protein AOLI_G00276780 [Acnodon oligacanthus]
MVEKLILSETSKYLIILSIRFRVMNICLALGTENCLIHVNFSKSESAYFKIFSVCNFHNSDIFFSIHTTLHQNNPQGVLSHTIYPVK